MTTTTVDYYGNKIRLGDYVAMANESKAAYVWTVVEIEKGTGKTVDMVTLVRNGQHVHKAILPASACEWISTPVINQFYKDFKDKL